MTTLALLEQTVRIAIPYLFAAAGGVIAERSGVISLALEGFMLTGAFAAVVGASATGSPWIGLCCGLVGGLVAGLLHGVLCLRFKANQIVVGVGINLLAVGATRLLLKLVFHSSSNSSRITGFGEEGAGALAMLHDPLAWAGVLVLPVVALWLWMTPFGLRLRAVGEHPAAAQSLGVRVGAVRAVAVALSGALAGLGGTYLALDQHQFTDGMTAGRGFIALAAIITGSWRPLRVGVACLVFAAAETLQIQLQSLQLIPSQLLSMIPYLVTIAVLVGGVGRSVPPAALGQPYEPSEG